MLVVAIDSMSFAARTRDLTPPTTSEIDKRFSPGGGGADRFLAFLEQELIPWVDGNYRTRPYRILAGHSYGGLFALHTLTRKPKLFHGYLAMDPSLSWNGGKIVTELEACLANGGELQADLLLTASNGGGELSRGVKKVAGILGQNAPAGFRASFEWLKNKTHGSLPLPAFQQGLDRMFDGWHLADPLELYEKGGIEAIHRHFRDGGRRWGFDRQTPPFTLSLVVAGLLKAGRLDEASGVLTHDPERYPPPWNQLDAVARAWEAAGDVRQALRYYTLSLDRNPNNEWARKKLSELSLPVP